MTRLHTQLLGVIGDGDITNTATQQHLLYVQVERVLYQATFSVLSKFRQPDRRVSTRDSSTHLLELLRVGRELLLKFIHGSRRWCETLVHTGTQGQSNPIGNVTRAASGRRQICGGDADIKCNPRTHGAQGAPQNGKAEHKLPPPHCFH